MALADLERLALGQRDRGLLDPVMDQHQATDLDPDTGNRATEYKLTLHMDGAHALSVRPVCVF